MRLVFKFFRGFDDFIMQKVYLLRLMLVCTGLIILSANYFCYSWWSIIVTVKMWIGLMLVLH
jgi:hypothetical protein